MSSTQDNRSLFFSNGNETAAVFIGAAIAHSTADGVKVVENGYDLARDEMVARATSSYPG